MLRNYNSCQHVTGAIAFRNWTLQTEKRCWESPPQEAGSISAPSPSIFALLAGTGRCLPSLVTAASTLLTLTRVICVTLSLLKTPPWCPSMLQRFADTEQPSAGQGQRDTPGRCLNAGTCLSHGCSCCQGAWAPCLCTVSGHVPPSPAPD